MKQIKMYDPISAKTFRPQARKRFGFCALILWLIVALTFSSTFKSSFHPLSKVGDAVYLQSSTRYSENFKPIATKMKKVEPICRTLELNIDYCEIEGDIRIEANSSTIFVVKTNENVSNSFTVEPYPRKGTFGVKNWTVTQLEIEKIPKCSQTHTLPSILFSLGGFAGNYFHDFSDLIFPLYLTSFHYQKEIHFLATDYNPQWIDRYREIIDKLTKYAILDIDAEKSIIHCYSKMIVGLNFHKELIPPSSLQSSMQNFRQILRKTYSLDRKTAIKLQNGDRKRPRLMMISRKKTRVIINDREISGLARKLGYEVDFVESENPKNLSRFAQKVNSCDVLMGIHGAGLTNMVFLPDNGVLIQVVPFGELEEFARLDFGDPANGMNIRYLEYKVTVNESSLSRQYPVDDPVLKNPKSFTTKGWDVFGSTYLDKQNVTIDLRRFEGVLTKSLEILR